MFIFTLSRRELPISHPKLQTIIHKDFLVYPPTLLSELEGVEACLWSLGTSRAGREVHLDYTLAAAHAFADTLATKLCDEKQRKFKFVLLSGAHGQRKTRVNPSRSLMRHAKHEASSRRH